MDNPIVKLTTTLLPKFESIKKDVDDFVAANQGKTKNEIAEKYGNRIC